MLAFESSRKQGVLDSRLFLTCQFLVETGEAVSILTEKHSTDSLVWGPCLPLEPAVLIIDNLALYVITEGTMPLSVDMYLGWVGRLSGLMGLI